jgi:hypothetical protein
MRLKEWEGVQTTDKTRRIKREVKTVFLMLIS